MGRTETLLDAHKKRVTTPVRRRPREIPDGQVSDKSSPHDETAFHPTLSRNLQVRKAHPQDFFFAHSHVLRGARPDRGAALPVLHRLVRSQARAMKQLNATTDQDWGKG